MDSLEMITRKAGHRTLSGYPPLRVLTEDKMKKIPLTQGKFALVDDEDYEWLMQWKWCVYWDGYTWRPIRGVHRRRESPTLKRFSMHREIMKHHGYKLDGMQVDHINHDGLDNRKVNLRVCTKEQNARNARKITNASSKYKGVSWKPPISKWEVRVRKYIGVYSSEIEAAKAYDKKAKELYGAFANLNFPEKA